ncbi:MAG: SurA N-terminal domain-containing protein [Myxococcaceae bacterium]|nr:SurA N-terminal domain-containing protein [Myxococcaceae bacterium]
MWLCLVAGASGAAPRLLDEAVAIVNGRVVTRSELDFEARVLLVRSGGVAAADAELDDALLAKVLDAVIGERLELAEAEKLKAWRVDPEDVQSALEAFKSRFVTRAQFDAFLERHEATAGELGALLERSLRVQRAFDGKLRLRSQVTEAEALATQAGRPDLEGLALEPLRAKLAQERYVTLVEQELKGLRKPGVVRLLGPFARRSDGGSR